jgi:proline iminopeptidase
VRHDGTMSTLYPVPATPLDEGFLDVGDGQRIHWWTAGNPHGKPLIMVHGGPGSGCPPSWARFCDPHAYRIVGFDQRGCGASTPDAADPATDLSVNTTQHLIADLERLREHLGIDRWLVLGASWGSTLSLAYGQQHPERVSEMVLFSVGTTSAREVEWITEAMGRVFPAQWKSFRDGARLVRPGTRLVDAYAGLLADDDPVFAYRFARLVTHYWRNAAFLAEDQLLRDVHRLHGIPAAAVVEATDAMR